MPEVLLVDDFNIVLDGSRRVSRAISHGSGIHDKDHCWSPLVSLKLLHSVEMHPCHHYGTNITSCTRLDYYDPFGAPSPGLTSERYVKTRGFESLPERKLG